MPKRILSGEIINNKRSKTLLVLVTRSVKHPLYKKIIKKSKKYSVHCEDEKKFNVGNVVNFIESKPFSKTKTWEVIE